MFLKWILFLSVLNVMDAQFWTSTCSLPRINHGKVRGRQNRKLIKFSCIPGYELVGNRYATCKDGEWDSPNPVCVKPGCPIPRIENGLTMPTRNNAWVMFFCLPGFRLVGSPAIYCNGRQWNTTEPSCVDAKLTPKLTCDFEATDLCGWSQDSLHDFDWERLNRKTPSSFLNTGPSFDHTYGDGQSGYYMYIESSSRLVNDTARLLSPIFDSALTKDGCFAFYYHMYGRDTGGLRVYQKPDSVPLIDMLSLPQGKREKYVLFEMWGNQGDIWWGNVAKLNNLEEDFQIVVEGIRGKKFTSDIAIDDVAILQGESCNSIKKDMVTPAAFAVESCEGRCGEAALPFRAGCGCNWQCVVEMDCCSDYIETCLYIDTTELTSTTELFEVATEKLPQTEKLVAKTTPITTTTLSTTTTTTTTTPKPTTKRIFVYKGIITKPTAYVRNTPPYERATAYEKDAITDSKPTVKTSKPPVTLAKPTIQYGTERVFFTRKLVTSIPKTTVAVKLRVAIPVKETPRKSWEEKRDKEKTIQERQVDVKSKSSVWTPILVVLALVLCCVGAVPLAAWARGARGRAALAALRGRTRRDPEVRYLSAHPDTD